MAQREVKVLVIGDASSLERAMQTSSSAAQSFGDKLNSVGHSMMSFGAKMTLGVTAPLTLLGKVAFDAASDLNESLSKVNVVFGESAGEITKWAKTAATSMGISRQAALEAAGTFGNLFRALGLGQKPAADMSKKLVGLASDLASFNNADPSEVLLALRSGLVGEVEPLRKFGVSLSQARIEAKAMEMGLWDGEDAISASAKAQAAYAIILEDTTLAQGDFGRTADGAANKQRILKAQFQDTAASLGRSLLPIFQQIAEVLSRVANWFSNLNPRVQEFAVYAAIAAAAIGPVVTGLGGLLTVITAISAPVLVIGAAIAALTAAAVLLYVKWDEVWSWMRDHPALAAIAILITSVVSVPIIALVGLLGLMSGKWDDVWRFMQSVAETVYPVLKSIFDALDQAIFAIVDGAEWLGRVGENAFNRFKDSAIDMWHVVDGPLGFIVDALEAIISAARRVRNALSNLPSPVPDFTPGFDIPGVPGFAEGGVIPGPIGAPQLVLAHGGEAVFNPDQLRALGQAGVGTGSGGPITVNLILDGEVIGQAAIDTINRKATRGPGPLLSAAVA